MELNNFGFMDEVRWQTEIDILVVILQLYCRSSVAESQFDSGNWSESVHTGVHDDEDLGRAPKFDDIMARLESATRQIRNKITSSVKNLTIRIKEPLLIYNDDVNHSFSGAVYNKNISEERRSRVNSERTSILSDCETKLEEQKLKQILLSKLAKYKV